MKMSENNNTWAVVELMGHITIAGSITKPGEYGGLWQVDIPEGETFRTEFFGSQSVYRIRIVSEEIARGYARPGHEIIEYDAPIITREEHLNAMQRGQGDCLHLSACKRHRQATSRVRNDAAFLFTHYGTIIQNTFDHRHDEGQLQSPRFTRRRVHREAGRSNGIERHRTHQHSRTPSRHRKTARIQRPVEPAPQTNTR